MLKKTSKLFFSKISFYKLSFNNIIFYFYLFSLTYSFPNFTKQNANNLPIKYTKNIKEKEIEENAELYLLSTKDGYLHALNKEKQEIWKTYLDQELMTTTLSKLISKNVFLYPLNELLYFIDKNKSIRFDIFIKDLVKKQYVSFNDLALVGKTKTTIFILDIENGEILQKIDEDSNFISNKKIYIRQKNRRKKTLTVARVDYILNCIEIKEEERFWNATYSDIIVKKGNDNDILNEINNNNFFYSQDFIKKIVNDYKNNNIENFGINDRDVITAYAYFNEEEIPNIKLFDRSISIKDLEEQNNIGGYRIRYLDAQNKNILIDENYGKKESNNILLNYIKDNHILILIIIFLCFIIFLILYYYNRKQNNNNNKEIKDEVKENKEEKKLLEKEEIINEVNKEIKNNIKDKEEKEKEKNIIQEGNKDIIREEKYEIKKEKELEDIKEITVSDENKTTSVNSKDNNNITDEIKEKPKGKERVRNAIWDTDEEEEKEGDDFEKNEKTKTKKNLIIKTKSNKNKSKIKKKEKEDDNFEESEDDEESEEEEEINEINIKKNSTKNKNNLQLNETETIKLKKKTRLDTDFENLEKIGEGGYGLVLKGTHRIDKFIYAIKIINISNIKNNIEIDDIINEANKMSMIKDKYIVNYNICWYEDNLGSAEKFYEKKEEESESSSNISNSEIHDSSSKKSNKSIKLLRQESKMDNLRSLYCTLYRDDSILDNNLSITKYKKKFFVILMEYCDGNTLEDLIKKHNQDSTPIERRLIYIYIKQILKGLKVLHRNGIIHSDIKPGNIFLKKVGNIEQIKIGDFGMAMSKKGLNKLNSKDIKGYTPLYSAPEQKNRKGTYNEKIDIYACGLILYELIGCFATNAEKYKAFDDLKENGIIFDEIEKKYKEESELIKAMTKKDYDERPSAEEILANDIFKGLGKIVNK